jgi:hypothetical protein
MKNVALLLVAFAGWAHSALAEMPTLREKIKLMQIELEDARGEPERAMKLSELAKLYFDAGDIESSKETLTATYTSMRNIEGGSSRPSAFAPYIETIRHRTDTIEGRLAILSGNIEEAKRRLLASANVSKRSPLLSSFGPSMSLANDLLVHGQREVVLEYLESCKVFWTNSGGNLDKWAESIKRGDLPDFGPSLRY